ncbi:MAG: TonB-dependent receptor [Flavobacteriales bacterium]|nr:TonB-dependent receptor [Flavobacteriales bacterium]
MKNTRTIMAMLALAAASHGMAQDMGEIHSKVLDPDGQPVEFGIVRVEQGGKFTGSETDAEGRFVLKPLPAGVYTVHVQGIGFRPAEITGVRVDPGLIARLKDIHLSSLLGTVTVERFKWEEPLIRPDDPSRMVMTSAQIETNATRKDPVKMIASITPGVTKAVDSDELYFRGSRAGTMAYYVDGVKVTGTNPGVPSEAISSVSVYTGGLPAKYGDVTGGVISIETKSYFDLYQQRNAGR